MACKTFGATREETLLEQPKEIPHGFAFPICHALPQKSDIPKKGRLAVGLAALSIEPSAGDSKAWKRALFLTSPESGSIQFTVVICEKED